MQCVWEEALPVVWLGLSLLWGHVIPAFVRRAEVGESAHAFSHSQDIHLQEDRICLYSDPDLARGISSKSERRGYCKEFIYFRTRRRVTGFHAGSSMAAEEYL